MSTIFIVRHGQSEGNVRGGFAGWTDYPLSELGKKQAKMTADLLKSEHIEFVLSSTLSRARETARPIAEYRGIEIIEREDIKEMNFGDWEGKPGEVVEAEYPGTSEIWRNALYKTDCPNGENMRQCFDRAVGSLCGIAKEYDGHDICLVSHGALIKCMLCFLHGLTLEEIQQAPWVDNASVTRVEYADGKFSLIYEGRSDHMGKYATGIVKPLPNA